MTEYTVCAACGASIRLPAGDCWMCRAPLVATPPRPANPPRDLASATLATFAAAVVALVLVGIFVVLLVEAPGIALGFAAVVLPLVAGLAVVIVAMQRQRRWSHAAFDARGDLVPRQTDWIDSAAKAVLIVAAVLIGIAALSLAAFVLFFIACLAMLSGSGGLNFH